ncbi:hypothetical protein PT286_04960 [Neisseriaceae bacterium ESL0693]|nr:hypothetical protein [Neisseriaceae bacterium ESL0693]
MLDLFKNTFNLSVCFALMGGFLGSMTMMFGEHKYSKGMMILLVTLSMVLSATLADYLFPPAKPWLYAGAGILVGMISSALLDAFRAMAPKLAGQILDVAGAVVLGLVEKWGNNKSKNN